MFYEQYWSEKEGHLSDFNLKWPKLKNFIPKTGGTIVDFGCGKGEILKEMIKMNPKADYVGLDVSETALAEAKKELPNVEFSRIEDGQPFPLADASADFIFASEVVEHIYDTENAFFEMARILKKGGRCLITTPHHNLIKNILIVIYNFDRHFNPTGSHVRFFSKKTLFALLRKNGLQVLKFGFYGRFWPLPHSIYVLAAKK